MYVYKLNSVWNYSICFSNCNGCLLVKHQDYFEFHFDHHEGVAWLIRRKMVCASSIPGAWPILSFLKALRKKCSLDDHIEMTVLSSGGSKGGEAPPLSTGLDDRPPSPKVWIRQCCLPPKISINRVDIPFTCSQCRSLRPGLQIICKSGMWTLNLSILLLTLSATLLGPGASPKVLVSFNTVLYMLPISSSTSSELMSVNGPFESKQK